MSRFLTNEWATGQKKKPYSSSSITSVALPHYNSSRKWNGAFCRKWPLFLLLFLFFMSQPGMTKERPVMNLLGETASWHVVRPFSPNSEHPKYSWHWLNIVAEFLERSCWVDNDVDPERSHEEMDLDSLALWITAVIFFCFSLPGSPDLQKALCISVVQ